MKKTLKMGDPHVKRIYNPKTGTYYLLRQRHDGKGSIIGKHIQKEENKKD